MHKLQTVKSKLNDNVRRLTRQRGMPARIEESFTSVTRIENFSIVVSLANKKLVHLPNECQIFIFNGTLEEEVHLAQPPGVFVNIQESKF